MSSTTSAVAAESPLEPPWLQRWLVVVALATVVMIGLGGIVRLTHSGLSIVAWQPLAGVIPPLSAADWQSLFDAYRETPEYLKVNAGMSLADFQGIFWLEFIHRIIGRIVGLIVAVPLIVGLLRRQFGPGLRRHVVGIGLLFIAQGVMGWLMVKSGLVDDPKVSPYRLTLHLALALTLLAWCLWLIFQRRWPRVASAANRRTASLATALLATVGLQIVMGGLVAGHRAGHASATFPLMYGHLIPPGLGSISPWWSNLVANPLTVHFDHRWFAFLVLGLAVALYRQLHQQEAPAPLHQAGAALMHMLSLQIGLGIATILTHVPVWLASLHQLGGIAVFSLAWLVFHQTREARSTP
jgi:cytochrome c oxidase assembly protein subunit 15